MRFCGFLIVAYLIATAAAALAHQFTVLFVEMLIAAGACICIYIRRKRNKNK